MDLGVKNIARPLITSTATENRTETFTTLKKHIYAHWFYQLGIEHGLLFRYW